VYGADSRESALFLLHKGIIAQTRGDTAAARVHFARAVQIVDSIPDIVASVRAGVYGGAARYWLAAGRPALADSLARRAVEDTRQLARGLIPLQAHAVYGATRLMVGATADAEQEFLAARALYERTGTRITSYSNAIGGGLAMAYDLEGRRAEAERGYAQLPPGVVKTLKAQVERLRSRD
jgi:hypothetical protein